MKHMQSFIELNVALARRVSARWSNRSRLSQLNGASPGADRRGLTHRSRLALVGSILLVFALGTNPAVNAVGLAEPELAPLASVQTYTVPASVAPLSVERNDVTVYIPQVLWPLASRAVSDGFGPRASPCDGCSSQHPGVDFPSSHGAPVRAVADGVVVSAGPAQYGSYGIWVVLRSEIHGVTVQTVYAHLSSVSVAAGSAVHAGQHLGGVGQTGAATGNHLHFEVIIGGSHVNPLGWLYAHAD